MKPIFPGPKLNYVPTMRFPGFLAWEGRPVWLQMWSWHQSDPKENTDWSPDYVLYKTS